MRSWRKSSGLAAEQVWYCGDSIRHDVIGAHGAGIYPVLYEGDTPDEVNPYAHQNDGMRVDFDYGDGYTEKEYRRRRIFMPERSEDILRKYVNEVHGLFGSSLKTIILYGSYARGDFRADSDIDIMILVDMEEQEIRDKGRVLSDVAFEYNFDNDIMIMPIVKNLEHFNKWLRAYPFYYNIKKEGIELYAA